MLNIDKMVRMIKAQTEFRTNEKIGEATGISGQAISNMTKTNNAHIKTLQRLADACDVKLSELIAWGED